MSKMVGVATDNGNTATQQAVNQWGIYAFIRADSGNN
jgi:hypothetical protein